MPDPYGFIQGQSRGDVGVFDGVQYFGSSQRGTDDVPVGKVSVAVWSDGSSGKPQINEMPTFKINRTEKITAPAHNLDPRYNAALSAQVTSLSNNASQSQGILAAATGYAATGNFNIGIYASGSVSSGTGSACGIFASAEVVPVGGGAQAVVTLVANSTGADQPYSASGGSTAADLYYSGAGGHYAGAAAQARAGPGQWDVGYAVLTSAVRSAAFRDDSSATTSFLVNGSHTNGIDLSGGTFSGTAIKTPWTTGVVVSDGSGVLSSSATIDNTYLTNRTRYIWIPASRFILRTGTPTLGMYDSNTVFAAWSMPNGSISEMATTFVMPSDYVASTAITIQQYITNLGAGTGNINVLTEINTRSNAADVNSTAGIQTKQDITAAPAQDILKVVSTTISYTPAAGNIQWLLCGRGTTSDTLGNASAFLGVLISYTADM